MTPEEALDACGPDWSKMSDADRIAYEPKPTRTGRAERTRVLLRRLAAEWGYLLVGAE
jgi:hypothetical protein